jgi:hypothetical protein
VQLSRFDPSWSSCSEFSLTAPKILKLVSPQRFGVFVPVSVGCASVSGRACRRVVPQMPNYRPPLPVTAATVAVGVTCRP